MRCHHANANNALRVCESVVVTATGCVCVRRSSLWTRPCERFNSVCPAAHRKSRDRREATQRVCQTACKHTSEAGLSPLRAYLRLWLCCFCRCYTRALIHDIPPSTAGGRALSITWEPGAAVDAAPRRAAVLYVPLLCLRMCSHACGVGVCVCMHWADLHLACSFPFSLFLLLVLVVAMLLRSRTKSCTFSSWCR
jgi:hypothetical protein